MSTALATFATPIGICGIAWSENGIVGVQLPEADENATLARLLRRYPQATEASPRADVLEVVTAVQRLLAGEEEDLAGVKLDLTGVPEFHQRVYEAARGIRPGATATYGEIASHLGDRTAARAVGQALGRNPFPIIVPCHRVVAAGSKLGGFSARGGRSTKAQLLSLEARHAHPAPSLFEALPWTAHPARTGGPTA